VEKENRLMWAQIGTLIMATSLIQLANGFFGSFISLRVAIEDFGATMGQPRSYAGDWASRTPRRNGCQG
jgi:hypothetical protein